MKTDSVTKKPQLHVSALNTLSFCGEQFRRRYVENEKIAPGIALIVGRAVDRAVGEDMTSKKETGELLPDEAIADAAADVVRSEIERDGLRVESEEDKELTLDQIADAGVDRSVRLSLTHHKQLAPTLRPLHIQRPFTVELKGFPVDLAGTWDLETEEFDTLLTDPATSPDQHRVIEAIRDTKTRKVSPPQTIADDDDQLTAYAFSKYVLDKRLPGKVTLDCVVDTKEPKVVVRESTRKIEDFRPFLSRVEVAVRAIERGVFVPAKQTDPLCSPKFCGYFATCPYVKRPLSVNVATVPKVAPTLEQALVASLDEARALRAKVQP